MPVEPPAPLLVRGKAWLNARDFQIAMAITLATAGLLSAWATYQSGLWDKRELEARATANARLTEASELVLRASHPDCRASSTAEPPVVPFCTPICLQSGSRLNAD